MDRRRFLLGVSALPLVGPLRASFVTPSIAYRLAPDAIEILRGQQLIASVPSTRPAVLIRHPNRSILFIINDIAEHNGLPTGTVEAYALESEGAHLRLLQRQPLSLAAIHPSHAVLSPDAQHLVIASQKAGIYNVLSVSPHGELGPVTQALKVLGIERRLQGLAFDSSGRAVRSFRVDGTLLTQLTFQDGQLRR